MKKIMEKELIKILRKFENRCVVVQIDGIVSGQVILEKLKYKYNKENGKIQLEDNVSKNRIEIEQYMAYMLLVNEDYTEIKIKLDNEEKILIKLQKICSTDIDK